MNGIVWGKWTCPKRSDHCWVHCAFLIFLGSYKSPNHNDTAKIIMTEALFVSTGSNPRDLKILVLCLARTGYSERTW
jgi:hypothetical protein